MKHALNLVPSVCLDFRSRARRQLIWSALVASLGALVFAGWLAVGRAREQHAQYDDRFAILQAQQTDLEMKLMRASRERSELYDRARKALWLSPENRVPEQLLALASLTPEGVSISDLKAGPFTSATPQPVLLQPTGSAPSASHAATLAAVPHGNPRRSTRLVQIGGWATTFADVQRFVEAIGHVPAWGKIELVKSARESRDGREMIQFRVDCIDAEGSP